MKNKIDIEKLVLAHGAHKTPEEGMCVMEAVAFVAGEKFSDHPACACPVLASYLRRLNDQMTAEERQLLKPYVLRLVGTRDGNSLQRAYVLAHWAGTVFAPMALEARGFAKEAAALRVVEFGDWALLRKLCRAAYAATYAAYAATYAAYAAAAADAAYAATYAADAAAYAATYAAAAADAAAADAAAYAAAARKPVIAKALEALDAALAVGKTNG